jgi:hypothetical protein
MASSRGESRAWKGGRLGVGVYGAVINGGWYTLSFKHAFKAIGLAKLTCHLFSSIAKPIRA